jgi:hypothetical protein
MPQVPAHHHPLDVTGTAMPTPASAGQLPGERLPHPPVRHGGWPCVPVSGAAHHRETGTLGFNPGAARSSQRVTGYIRNPVRCRRSKRP